MRLEALHPSDGDDETGAQLTLSIRIGPDGTLYFHDLTAALLPVAAALCPDDAALAQRLIAAAAFGRSDTAQTQESR